MTAGSGFNILIFMPENMNEVVIEAEQAAVLEEMAKAGVLYGRKKSKTNPKMAKYIHTVRNGVAIFDLTETLSAIDAVAAFLKEIAQKGGKLLLVGAQSAAKDVIKRLADKFGFPYVTERWLGGTLTNFKTLSKRIDYYLKLKTDRATGKLEKYTKKERLGFDREIERMEKFFGGLEKLNKLPEVLLVVDTVFHDAAVREANRLKIPVIGIMNSDSNPDSIQYPIPANTGARPSVIWVLEKLEKAIEEGKTLAATVPKPEILNPKS